MPSFDRQFLGSRFGFPLRLRWLALGWVVAELLTFMLLVKVIGLGGTLLLGLATTVLGLVLMRRLGIGAMQTLRRRVEGSGAADGAMLDGLLAALASLLLIVPGFLANAAGLSLAAPSGRRALIRRFGGIARGPSPGRVRRPARTDVIDLGPEDWTPVDRR